VLYFSSHIQVWTSWRVGALEVPTVTCASKGRMRFISAGMVVRTPLCEESNETSQRDHIVNEYDWLLPGIDGWHFGALDLS
jgi:hypothetical protein